MKTSDKLRRHLDHRLRKALLLAAKVGLGSAMAIYLATLFDLQNPAAAGTIALLTLVNTRRATIQLIIRRFLSFGLTIGLCMVLFQTTHNHYLAFGIFLLFIVLITELLDWGNTLSVNALIGMHCMSQRFITPGFVLNEFYLLCIGVFLAFVLNQMYSYRATQQHLYRCILDSDEQMQQILEDLIRYIHKEPHIHPWRAMEVFKKDLENHQKEAQQFLDNFYNSSPLCFVRYFSMRLAQYQILENLHVEIRKIRFMPAQGEALAQYIQGIIPYVRDHTIPEIQIQELQALLEDLKKDYTFQNRQEFEDQAILFHILMDLEDILQLKTKFLEQLDEEQKELFFSTPAQPLQIL